MPSRLSVEVGVRVYGCVSYKSAPLHLPRLFALRGCNLDYKSTESDEDGA